MSDQKTNKYVEAGAHDALRALAFMNGVKAITNHKDMHGLLVAYVQSMPKVHAGISVVMNDTGNRDTVLVGEKGRW